MSAANARKSSGELASAADILMYLLNSMPTLIASLIDLFLASSTLNGCSSAARAASAAARPSPAI